MTYTAVAGGGNWNAPATWGGTSGYPVAGDTAVLNSGSGNVTVNVASACDDLTCTGYTGTLTMSAQLSIYGNCTLASGMTLAATTYGFTFAATTTGKTITSAGLTHGNVVFNGSGGGWTLQDDFTRGSYPADLAFVAGTLNLGGNTMTSGSAAFTSGFTLNVGSGTLTRGYLALSIGDGVTVTVSSGYISAVGSLTVSGTGVLQVTGAGVITCNGNIDLGDGFDCGTGTIVQWTGNLKSTQPLYNYEQGVSWYWDNSSVTMLSDIEVLNDFTIATISSYTATFDCDTYTLKVGGNFTNNEVFDAGTGTVELIDDTKTSTITGSSATTFNVLKCQAAGKTVKFKASQTVTVASFDFDGATGDLITLDTDTGSGTWTLSDSSGTDSVTYCDIHRSTASGGATFEALTSNGNVDGGSNTGWTFSGGGTPVEVLADGLRLVTAEGSAQADSRRLLTGEASALSDGLRYVQADATALADAKRYIEADASALPDATRFVQVDASALPDSLRHVSTSASVQSDTRRTVVATVEALADSLRIVVTGMYAIVRADVLRLVTTAESARADARRLVTVTAQALADARRQIAVSALALADTYRGLTQSLSVRSDTLRQVVGEAAERISRRVTGLFKLTVRRG